MVNIIHSQKSKIETYETLIQGLIKTVDELKISHQSSLMMIEELKDNFTSTMKELRENSKSENGTQENSN